VSESGDSTEAAPGGGDGSLVFIDPLDDDDEEGCHYLKRRRRRQKYL
jgi:hypothetical protein